MAVVLPTLLIIGAEKAGTTALSQFLRQHPDVCFSCAKKTWFSNRHYGKEMTYINIK